MMGFCGKVLTIKSKFADETDSYNVKETFWSFSPWMFDKEVK
jgi:hypothetical protein